MNQHITPPEGTPPIGWTVHYFEQASRKNKPQSAVVVDFSTNGLITVLAWSLGGGEPVKKKSIRHVDDPQLKKSPQLAARSGGWDWIPGHVYRPPGEPEVKEDDELKVVELAEQHDFHVVCNKVRGRGLGKEAVRAIYRKHNLGQDA